MECLINKQITNYKSENECATRYIVRISFYQNNNNNFRMRHVKDGAEMG